MLCHGETNQMFKTSHILYWTFIFFNIFFQLSITLSVPDVDFNSSATMVTNNTGNNSINDDLYVIKAIVYEIGILTDADNATNDTTERQEEVRLSFYNSPTNSSES